MLILAECHARKHKKFAVTFFKKLFQCTFYFILFDLPIPIGKYIFHRTISKLVMIINDHCS